MRVLTFLFIIFAQTVLAQGSIKVTNGSGALLRTLDRLSGNVTDFKITNGAHQMKISKSYLIVINNYITDKQNADLLSKTASQAKSFFL